VSIRGPRGLLSIVVPAYNEAGRLPTTLSRLRNYLDSSGREYEVILVDDGSTDGTLALMHQFEQSWPAARAVSLGLNRGKGRAVAEGVRASRGEMVLFTDADLSTPIEELSKLEEAVERGADVACGSRAGPGSRQDQPLHRRVMGNGFSVLVRLLLLPGFRDSQCGFKYFRGMVARELFAALRTDGFAFDVELIWRARQAGYRVEEVPVRWINAEDSQISPFRHSAQVLRDVLILRLLGWMNGGSRQLP
jgi:dolichyl-phosphate beta-glucosyltransferase